jgi:hypothetical protein
LVQSATADWNWATNYEILIFKPGSGAEIKLASTLGSDTTLRIRWCFEFEIIAVTGAPLIIRASDMSFGKPTLSGLGATAVVGEKMYLNDYLYIPDLATCTIKITNKYNIISYQDYPLDDLIPAPDYDLPGVLGMPHLDEGVNDIEAFGFRRRFGWTGP